MLRCYVKIAHLYHTNGLPINNFNSCKCSPYLFLLVRADVGHQSPCPERLRRLCCILQLSELPLTLTCWTVSRPQLDAWTKRTTFGQRRVRPSLRTEPSSCCRNRLLAAPSKRWPKICSSLLSHHVASIDVTNFKGHVLMVIT